MHNKCINLWTTIIAIVAHTCVHVYTEPRAIFERFETYFAITIAIAW